MTAEMAIMWADREGSDTPERAEAEAALSDILRTLGVQAGGTAREHLIQRLFLLQGVSNRRGYDLGWAHCEGAIRE